MVAEFRLNDRVLFSGSQVSMPVVLNEPIGMLQRLCEELEYSELLDKVRSTANEACPRFEPPSFLFWNVSRLRKRRTPWSAWC